MIHPSTNPFSCLSRVFPTSRYNDLAQRTSSFLSTSVIAKLAAASLIVASAGLGAVYAWTSGAHHGSALACLLVLMALGLELAKPLSIAAAFDALRSWRPVQAAALAILGLVAVTYSLTAELSLMATSRGDLVAERTAGSDKAAKANDRYDRAKLELLTLPTTRPKAELEQKIASLLLTSGVNGCEKIDGKVTRQICPQVSELRVEAARADRRDALEATMREAEQQTANAPAAKMADPGASALAAYLSLLGLNVDPALLTNLLLLVGVLALEVGSALSIVMVRAVTPEPSEHVVQAPPPKAMVPVVHPENTSVSEPTETARDDVKKRVLTHLKKSGGKASGTQRGLAKLIGVDKSTMRRAINGLVTAGVIAAEATRNGTMLRLVS